MAKTVKHNNFDTVITTATITATSNKSDGKYKQEKPTKTVYLVPKDEKEAKKLVDFGLTQYTPDADKDPDAKPYFIVKATETVKAYTSEEDFEELHFGVNHEEVDEETGEVKTKKTPNYKTDKPVGVAIVFVEGKDKGNDFYRLNALLLDTPETLEEVQPVNPFASLFK